MDSDRPETARSFAAYLKQHRYKIILSVAGAIGLAGLGLVPGIFRSISFVDGNLMASRFEQFVGLDDTPRRAAVFVDYGSEGTPDDVRAVYRHFRVLVADVRAGRITLRMLADTYLGQLAGWSNRFGRLGRSEVPGAARFSAEERDNFARMARFLGTAYAERSPGGRDHPTYEVTETMNMAFPNAQ